LKLHDHKLSLIFIKQNNLMGIIDFLFNSANQEKFRPSSLQDDFAMEVSWNPLIDGGTNFRTHKAVKMHYKRIEFKKTLLMHIFPWFFIIIPIFVLFRIGILDVQSFENFTFTDHYIEILISSGFFLAAVFFMLRYRKPIVFDQSFGYFWKGKYDPRAMSIDNKKEYIKLDDIYALQILKEWNNGSKNSSGYNSYELNLILKNKERVNVIDHGAINSLKKDALMISEFLNVPLWDASMTNQSEKLVF